MQFAITSLATICFSGNSAHADEPKPLKTTVVNGSVTRELPIVRFVLPKAWQGHSFDVVEQRGDKPTCPVQVDGDVVYWRAHQPIGPGETVTFQLRPNQHIESWKTVAAEANDKAVVLSSGVGKVLQYNVATVPPPAGISPLYRRSGHLHPVWTPSGKVVTEEFPADHIHQHGVFSAWVNTIYDGEKTDFWNQGGGSGTVAHKAVESTDSGPVFARLVTTLEQQALTKGENPRPAIRETMTIRTYASPRSTMNVFDVDISQTTASPLPLHLLKYHYGGFAIRGAKEWFEAKEIHYLTSDGKTALDGNETRPKWVCLYGDVGGQPCGITVIPHPDSFRGPQPVRLHPTKPYFVYSPSQLGEFDITPTRPYQAQFRLIAHDGGPDAKLFDQLAEEFASPLTAK